MSFGSQNPPSPNIPSSSDIPVGLVAGIVIIAVVLIATLITLLVVVCLKMRNRQQQDIEARSLPATDSPVRADRLQFPINNVPDAIGPSDLSPPHPVPVFQMTTNASSDHANVNLSYDPNSVGPSCNRDSSWAKDPHYASPRSPINKDNLWSEDPHYVSPRSPRCSKNSAWKEDPHYASPRSPCNNRQRLREEETFYANLPLQTNELKKESVYDNPPIPRSVQDIGCSLPRISTDQSSYDYVGKPRPVKDSHSISESTNSLWPNSRKFKSPFASAEKSNTCEETEPIYANT